MREDVIAAGRIAAGDPMTAVVAAAMRSWLPGVALLLLAVVAAPAFAQDGESRVDCADPVTQQDMNDCANRDFEAADAELNAVYKQAMAAMRKTDAEMADLNGAYAGAVEALKKAQRGWVAYRDGTCTLAGFEARGGSMEPMLVSGCLAETTRKRTADLKDLVTPPQQ